MHKTIILFAFIILAAASCHKIGDDPQPIPTWENTKADSATLRILIETMNGTPLPGQYVNLALSLDSLNKGILVRRTMSNSLGITEFRRLYPRKFYYNCFANYENGTLFGSGYLILAPYAVKDTFLVVY